MTDVRSGAPPPPATAAAAIADVRVAQELGALRLQLIRAAAHIEVLTARIEELTRALDAERAKAETRS
jgi:hypothetical protein